MCNYQLSYVDVAFVFGGIHAHLILKEMDSEPFMFLNT